MPGAFARLGNGRIGMSGRSDPGGFMVRRAPTGMRQIAAPGEPRPTRDA